MGDDVPTAIMVWNVCNFGNYIREYPRVSISQVNGVGNPNASRCAVAPILEANMFAAALRSALAVYPHETRRVARGNFTPRPPQNRT